MAEKKAIKKAATKATAKKTTAKKADIEKSASKATAKSKKLVKAETPKTPAKAPKKAPARTTAAVKTPAETKAKSPTKAPAKAKTPAKTTAPGKPKAPVKATTPVKVKAPAEAKQPEVVFDQKTLSGFVKKQYQRLLDLRDDLMDSMYGMQQETLKSGLEGGEASGSGEHTGDAGSDAYDREFALNLLAKDHNSLEEIEAAIKRVESGVYGVCELSGEKIPHPRLEAIPFARLTVAMQTKWEQENGSTRFRPRDEYGFKAD